ncbi:acyl-CoA dehydrogenase family protein [Sphingomonas sp.]|uniref:acyl-CoA dehydrogenase family protein n=1 Tax=Sphingomonas sp. TaxID=28214 RepID=UPI0035C7CDA5
MRTDEQRMLAEMLDAQLAGGPLPWTEVIDATGLALLGVPEADGGLGTELRDAAVVAAALGRGNAGLPWPEHWAATRGLAGDDASDALALLHCAELVGLCRTMMRDTARFLHERRQFGVAIASFQALRHRMADMAMALEQAEAMVDLALDGQRPQAVSAARVLAEDAARAVGEGAVQLHGAMGLTAELRLGGYFRRTRVLMQADGTARAHLRRYAAA